MSQLISLNIALHIPDSIASKYDTAFIDRLILTQWKTHQNPMNSKKIFQDIDTPEGEELFGYVYKNQFLSL